MSVNTNIKETPQDVFVVTRDGRRTSDKNFSSHMDAKAEAGYWINLVRKFDPRSKISIAKTNKPKRIR